LAPILFVDNDKPAAAAKRSDTALNKASRKRTEDDHPVHSLTSLIADLATICANHIQPADDMPAVTMITHTSATASLRTTGRLLPVRPGVVCTSTPPDHKSQLNIPTR